MFEGERVHIGHADRSDAGVYQCLASNGISTPATRSVQLRVQCNLILDLFMKLYIVLMFSQAALSLLEFFNAVNSVNMPN